MRKDDCIPRLVEAGISYASALTLRRIAMTLHRWHELECGDVYGNAIERDEETGRPYATYQPAQGPRKRYPVADRERGALKRLARIMNNYPGYRYYVQSDPRGAALYILRPGDLPEGADISSHYTHGIAVYK